MRVIVVLAFQNHTDSPLTDLRRKTRVFSHPVNLSLREFSLQDYRGDSIEPLNSFIRAAIKKRKVFPTDDAVRKVIFLAIKDAPKKMEYADPELAAGDEPFYYRVR